MRRFYTLGVLGATAVAAVLGLKVTKAWAELNPCPNPKKCWDDSVPKLKGCDEDDCGSFSSYDHLNCGVCPPNP